MEDEFAIGPALTAGKERVRLELRCAAGTVWRAASYGIFTLEQERKRT